MTTTLTERLQARRQTISQTARARWTALVRSEEWDLDEAAEILSANGKTEADLDAARVVYRRRLALVAEIEAGPAARARKEVLAAERDRIIAERDAAVRKCDEQLAPINAEDRKLDDIVGRAERGAPQQLRESCPYPEVHAALAEIQRRIQEAQAEAAALRKRAGELEFFAARGENLLTAASPASFEASRRHRQELAQVLGQVAVADKRIVELQAEHRTAELKLLEA